MWINKSVNVLTCEIEYIEDILVENFGDVSISTGYINESSYFVSIKNTDKVLKFLIENNYISESEYNKIPKDADTIIFHSD